MALIEARDFCVPLLERTTRVKRGQWLGAMSVGTALRNVSASDARRGAEAPGYTKVEIARNVAF